MRSQFASEPRIFSPPELPFSSGAEEPSRRQRARTGPWKACAHSAQQRGEGTGTVAPWQCGRATLPVAAISAARPCAAVLAGEAWLSSTCAYSPTGRRDCCNQSDPGLFGKTFRQSTSSFSTEHSVVQRTERSECELRCCGAPRSCARPRSPLHLGLPSSCTQ